MNLLVRSLWYCGFRRPTLGFNFLECLGLEFTIELELEIVPRVAGLYQPSICGKAKTQISAAGRAQILAFFPHIVVASLGSLVSAASRTSSGTPHIRILPD